MAKHCQYDLDPSQEHKYKMMFREITGEGKNNHIKKKNLDLIRLKKTGKDRMNFAW